MKKNLLAPFVGLLFCILLFSCVKDTDFDQVHEVTATPIVELDLIHFNLDAEDFYDETTDTPRLTVADTTEIRFLNDIETQESLVRADFLFVFTNSIPRGFQTDFTFLSQEGEETYATNTQVAAGTPETPVVTEFSHVVEGESILQLTQSDRVVVTVTIPSSDASLQGTLNLKSKTTYYLEVKERN